MGVSIHPSNSISEARKFPDNVLVSNDRLSEVLYGTESRDSETVPTEKGESVPSQLSKLERRYWEAILEFGVGSSRHTTAQSKA
jgi:hypothetical protein